MSTPVIRMLQCIQSPIVPEHRNDVSELARNHVEDLQDQIGRVIRLSEGLGLCTDGAWVHMQESEVPA